MRVSPPPTTERESSSGDRTADAAGVFVNKRIQEIFSEVPDTYELVNRVLTLGFDRFWRRRAAKLAVSLGGRRMIDVCSGTGETALYVKHYAGNGARIFAADFSSPMLRKAIAKKRSDAIVFLLSDVGQLPLIDNSFDVITISFATRNINLNREALLRCFREFRRILAPGGSFINLETSQPSSGLFRALVHFYVRLLVRPIGTALSGSKAGYRYLSRTIPRFYTMDQLRTLLIEAGFTEVNAEKLLFGVAAIHHAKK